MSGAARIAAVPAGRQTDGGGVPRGDHEGYEERGVGGEGRGSFAAVAATPAGTVVFL